MSAEATYENLSKKTTTEVVTVISRTTTKSANSSCAVHCNTALCKKRQYSYIKVSVAPSRGTCDVRYNSFLKKQKDVWEGGKGKFKDTVITKRKSLVPQTFCRRKREGVSMPKKNGGGSEANVGGYSMYTQRHLMLSSTFKHQQWGVIKQQPDNEHTQINQTREREINRPRYKMRLQEQREKLKQRSTP